MDSGKVMLITESKEMKNVLNDMIADLPLKADVDSYSIEEGLPQVLDGQTVILSPVIEKQQVEPHLSQTNKTITARLQLQPAVFEEITAAFQNHSSPSILSDKTAPLHIADSSGLKPNSFPELLGLHPLLTEARILAAKLSAVTLPVFIEGETGTGKRSFARAIHSHSKWGAGPFIAVNCRTLSSEQIHSLFQRNSQQSIFSEAGGTLYLEETGELSSELQARVLASIQSMESEPGSFPEIRLISSSSSIMKEKVKSGDFRADLYYRLSAAPLRIPSLRERKSDIPLLLEAFLQESGYLIEAEAKVMDILMKEDWEGNLRELKNMAAYLAAVSGGKTIQIQDLPGRTGAKKTKKKESSPPPLTMMDKKEFAFILDAIHQSNDHGEPASRRSISELSKTGPVPLTPQQVRHRLDYLEKHQYVTKGRGRAGTKITLEGMDFLQSLKSHLTSS
ncbi:sigma 54-interacting transcriptional regulator [Metabacillus mangrovi]|nr:sigma 54-interacting transcriptional regulator [Metabacillus mangrovi]